MPLSGHETDKGDLRKKMLRKTYVAGVHSTGECVAPLGEPDKTGNEGEHHDGQKHLH
jgi:hypothetical protein